MIRRLGTAAARAARQRPQAVSQRVRSYATQIEAAASPAVASTSSLRPQPQPTDTKLKSTDLFGSNNPRLNAALITALNPRPGSGVDGPDPTEVLKAVKGYLDLEGAELPVTHRNNISSLLSRHYSDTAASDDEVVAVADALWTICGDPHSVTVTSARGNKHYVAVVARYSRWMAAEAKRGDDKRVRVVLEAFERQLRQASTSDCGDGRLWPSQAAAWVLLRARLGITKPVQLVLRLPSLAQVMGQLVKLGGDKDDPVIKASAEALFSDAAGRILPSTPKSLEGRLAFLRGDGNLTLMADMWATFEAMLDSKTKHGLMTDGGHAALGAFIWACSPWRNELKQDRAALLPILEAARARVPKPTPLPVFHAMLRAPRAADSNEIDTHDEVNPRAADRDVVLANANATWERVRSEGVVPDVHAYGQYLRLLGYHGEWTAMFKIWDDLIQNKEAQELWIKEISSDKSRPPSETELNAWPPTIILNQVLSSAFMIGQRPADMGMALFEAAVNPSSSLEPDVVTINTVLRWAAHLANIPMINQVIGTAGKLKIKPDIVTYTTMVHGLLRAERPDLARATLDAMRSRGIEPNDVMASMLVADLASDGTSEGLRRAEYVIRDMRARGLRTTLPMWTALIGGYFSGGWDLDGWDALARMKANGHRLNDKAWNIVLKQLTRGTKVSPTQRAELERRGAAGDGDNSTRIRLFRQMVREGVVPNADTYYIMLDSLIKGKRTIEVMDVLADMRKRAFETRRPALKRLVYRAQMLVKSTPI